MRIQRRAAGALAAAVGTIAIGLAPVATQPAAAQPASATTRADFHRATLALSQVKRSTVMDRAWFWHDRNVQYSQTSYYPGPGGRMRFRQDCSGFVSMAWMLGTSATTSTLGNYSHRIRKGDLRRGDALNKPGQHTVLFHSWVAGTSRTRLRIIEQSNPTTDMNFRTVSLSSYSDFNAIRRDRIVNG